MIYLYHHNNQWMCFETESLPVKPDVPSEYAHLPVDFPNYNQAIATLKSKALPVQNYGEIYTIANDNLDREIKLPCIEVEGIGEVFEWSGTVEKKEVDTVEDGGGCYVAGSQYKYILHLPKPDMSDKEPLNEMYYIDGPDEFVKGEPSLTEQQRIEKEAIEYVIKETGYQVLPEHDAWKNAYISGANATRLRYIEALKELIPIAEERLRRIVNYDMPDYHKVTGNIKSAIERAKALL